MKLIPRQNRDKFIASLLGNILSQVKNEPHKWEITFEYFEDLIQEISPQYTNPKETPLPTEYEQIELPLGVIEQNNDLRFVQKIKDINYETEIPEAISDYWKTNMTIAAYYLDNIVFNSSLDQYQYRLSRKLNNFKKPIVIQNRSKSRDIQVENSKVFYSSVMNWEATPFGSVNPNYSFFQNGTIHSLMQSKTMSWDVGENL